MHFLIGPKDLAYEELEDFRVRSKVTISPLLSTQEEVIELFERQQKHNQLKGNRFLFVQLVSSWHDYSEEIWKTIYHNKGISFIAKPYKFYDQVKPQARVETLVLDPAYKKFKLAKKDLKRSKKVAETNNLKD